MAKYSKFQQFIKRNWNINKEINKSSKKLLFVDRERFYPAFVMPIIAIAISRKRRLSPIVLSDLKDKSEIKNIYKAYGLNNFLTGLVKKEFFKDTKFFFKSISYTFIVLIKLLNKDFYWFINNFRIKNIPIGDLIYDLYIRKNENFTKNKIDFYFIKLLYFSIFRFLKIYKLIITDNINYVFCTTEFYSGNNGLALRIASYKKIKNMFVFHDIKGQLKLIENTDKNIFRYGAYSFYRNKNLKSKINIPISIENINNFYFKRKKLKTLNVYTNHDYNKANQTNILNNTFISKIKKNKKKKILYASHALSDAAHSFGTKFIFANYFDQLKQTLNFINSENKKDHLWIIKSHPNSKDKNENNIFKNLVKSFQNKNIILCPQNVSTNKLIEISDVIISGRGTISLEATCMGKVSINCGFSTYSKLGLVYEADTKKQYFNYLRRVSELKKPKRKKIFKAKKALYILENDLIDHKKINNYFLNQKVNTIFKKNIEDKEKLASMFLSYLKDTKGLNNIIKKISLTI